MLNIYVPETAFESALPVMAWIHGGALIRGSNNIKVRGLERFFKKYFSIVKLAKEF